MDDLRLILLICGVVLLVAIYLFELVRKRFEARRKNRYPIYSLEESASLNSMDGAPDTGADIERAQDLRAARNVQSVFSNDSMAEESVEAEVDRGQQRGQVDDQITPGFGDTTALVGDESGRVIIDDLAALEGIDSTDSVTGATSPLGGLRGDRSFGAPRLPETLDMFPEQGSAGKAEPSVASSASAELIIVLTIVASDGERLSGKVLGEALVQVGMEHGDMGLFHAYETQPSASTDPRAKRIARFSLANAVSPGTLAPSTLAQLQTPGFALFMRLPGPSRPTETFQTMLSVGMELAERLGGVLCDETHSALTQQVIGHLQEKIAEWGRQQLLR